MGQGEWRPLKGRTLCARCVWAIFTTPDYGGNFRCRQTLMNFVFDILMIE